QRKLIQPLMHTKQIESYANTMTQFGERLIQQWKNGSQRDIHQDMTQVTMEIIAATMFDSPTDSATQVQDAVKLGQAIAISELKQPIDLPGWFAQKKSEDIRSVNDALDSVVNYLL